MPSPWLTPFIRPRRSFHRLRSFQLSPTAVATSHAPAGSTISPTQTNTKKSIQSIIPLRPVNLSVPLRGKTIIILAIATSLLFIMSISMAFLGADADEPPFMRALDTVAKTSPGVVLVGESVDVDIDEPSITIRWSITACGEGFMLPGSSGAHGSSMCGLPASAMHFYVDNDNTPVGTYDPLQIPFNRGTGNRRSIQNLVQFDSDHVLDVHEARLYPFDTYVLSSTIRAVSFTNQTVPISKAMTIDLTSSFNIYTIDLESYSITDDNGTQENSRDIDMHVSRPNDARFFTLLLFAVSWILTHVTIGHVLIARRLTRIKSMLPHLVSSGAIVIAIPQLRNSMPDAPGLDGVLIDSIGYFPQMVIVTISTITLLLIVAAREFDMMGSPQSLLPVRSDRSNSLLSQIPRPPRSPTASSTSMEIAQWEMRRMLKHLKGEYVFPPIKPSHRLQPSDTRKGSHRKMNTMPKIMEDGQVSR